MQHRCLAGQTCPEQFGWLWQASHCKPACCRPCVCLWMALLYCSVQDGSLLSRLGLREDIIRNTLMARDIVPRAFSCDYSPVAELLRSWGPNWREHTCLAGGMTGRCRQCRQQTACLS